MGVNNIYIYIYTHININTMGIACQRAIEILLTPSMTNKYYWHYRTCNYSNYSVCVCLLLDIAEEEKK